MNTSPKIKMIIDMLHGERHGLAYMELIQNLFSLPAILRGKLKIKKIISLDKYFVLSFYDCPDALYWPQNMDINLLYLVIADLFYPYRSHYYETEGTKVSPDDIVADCGAAEGLFGLLIVRRCKKIYLIEPVPDFSESLNLTFKGFKNVEVVPFALGEREGDGFLSNNGLSISLNSWSEKATPVKIITMDSLFYDRNNPVTYIKADLEGNEIDFLKGAQNTIKYFGPKIAITTYHKPEHARQITDYLRRTNPNYKFKIRGLAYCNGTRDAVLHAWVE